MDKIERIGLQLYTVRTEMEKSVEETLREVAAIGYQEVEFAGYFDHSPQEIRRMLDRYGLTAPAIHVGYQSIESNLPQVVESAQIIGHRYIVIPMMDGDLIEHPEAWKRAADLFNRAGEFSKQAGIQLAYHNHFFEFLPVDGKLLYDFLLESCDPDLLKMELDLCWIAAAGKDPSHYFKRYPGRFPLVHLKQLKKLPDPPSRGESRSAIFERAAPEMTEVGEGAIDWKHTLSQASQAGVEHYFVEHDAPRSPFDSIRTSYDYLQNLRF
jgi:sugar phosphate isomerase/epimerase